MKDKLESYESRGVIFHQKTDRPENTRKHYYLMGHSVAISTSEAGPLTISIQALSGEVQLGTKNNTKRVGLDPDEIHREFLTPEYAQKVAACIISEVIEDFCPTIESGKV